jgi:hypothetical protein
MRCGAGVVGKAGRCARRLWCSGVLASDGRVCGLGSGAVALGMGPASRARGPGSPAW